MKKIYKDYYQLADNEIEDIENGLQDDMSNPVFAQAGMGMPGDPGGMPGEEVAPEAPPPVAESKEIDFGAMKSLALEAGCDDELLVLLESFESGDHFNKQDKEQQSK